MGVLVAVSGVSCGKRRPRRLALLLCLSVWRSSGIWRRLGSWGHLEAILGCLEASSGAHVDAVGGHPAELFTLRESPPAQPKTATLAKSTDYRDLLVIFSATMPRGPEELL